jgi:RNA polymerase sigma-70 factor (ECF subfamily)
VSSTAPGGQAADREVFERFFRAHERDVFGYLWRLTGEEQAAYDLSQETFLRAWQHFDRVRTYERPAGWLLRIATNLALTYLKRRKAPVGAATALPDEGGPAASDPAWRLAERESVAGILAALPERQRAALVLFDVYGLNGEELAGALGISVAAAKMLLARARAQFRALYRREEGVG